MKSSSNQLEFFSLLTLLYNSYNISRKREVPYLDYAANTPIEKEVLDTYYQATMKYFANPNASHTLGLQAKEVIDQTTKHIAEQLHVLPEEIIYTSGASEANNLAIKGILERYKHRGKHVLISPLEHNSILSSLTKMQENGFIVEMIPLKEDGQVNVEKNEINDSRRYDFSKCL